jgi:hypothetical protein
MIPVHLCLLFLGSVSAELPKPVIEFSFEKGLRNSGTVGGAAVVESHADNEGPFFSPGPWGTCVDMSDASRFGGTIEQTEPSGSSLIFTHDRVRVAPAPEAGIP